MFPFFPNRLLPVWRYFHWHQDDYIFHFFIHFTSSESHVNHKAINGTSPFLQLSKASFIAVCWLIQSSAVIYVWHRNRASPEFRRYPRYLKARKLCRPETTLNALTSSGSGGNPTSSHATIGFREIAGKCSHRGLAETVSKMKSISGHTFSFVLCR